MKNDELNVQNEDAFLYHEEDPETDADHEDIERIEKCNDDDADDVRIDDVLREIINKRSDDTQVNRKDKDRASKVLLNRQIYCHSLNTIHLFDGKDTVSKNEVKLQNSNNQMSDIVLFMLKNCNG